MHEQKVTKLDYEDYFFPKLTEMGSIIWPQKIRFLVSIPSQKRRIKKNHDNSKEVRDARKSA